MTVCIDGNAIVLRGSCGIEEVEPFVGYLEARPDLPVDLTGVEAVHTALWQAIMVYRPIVTGSPNSPFLEAKLLPALRSSMEQDHEPDAGELAKASPYK